MAEKTLSDVTEGLREVNETLRQQAKADAKPNPKKHFLEEILTFRQNRLFHKQGIKFDLDRNKELDEITVTGDIAGYDSPMAFGDNSKKSKKKKKKIATNSTGNDVVREALGRDDEKQIRKLIRKVVGNIFRDLWIKRSVWRNPSSKD